MLSDKWKKAESIALIAVAVTATGGFMIEILELRPRLSELETTEQETSQQLEELSESAASLTDLTSEIEQKQEVVIGGLTQELQDIILHKPFAVIDGPQVVNPNQSVTYSAERSTDPDGKITRYEWLIDDKIEYLGLTISHVFVETGQHSVVLTVYDDDGNKGWRTWQVIVQEPLK